RTDGVVAYESAHIEGVASEKVVHSGHSTQGHPETIEEVKRILIEHLGKQPDMSKIKAPLSDNKSSGIGPKSNIQPHRS
ncbi:MAG: hypothetical protein ACM3TN_17650, partial [Alphaproteobacteria bacterium]